MGLKTARSAMAVTGRILNEVLSFVIFSVLDLLDLVLCLVYKVVDYVKEAEWKPCYCSSAKDMIVVAEKGGGSKIVRLYSSRLQMEDISDTLYSRPSLVADVSRTTVRELQRLRTERRRPGKVLPAGAVRSGAVAAFKINSNIVEMLEGKIFGQQSLPVPRWSDCDCKTCNGWSSNSVSRTSLFVHADGPKDEGVAEEDVLFIHGFISSSAFWTETVFPNFSDETKKKYRLFAIDLLGFGRSPKPADSLYTLREHLDMIERSVLLPYSVKSFHIVAHSLGSVLALALAVKYPGSVKSLTLLAPPYFLVPKGEQGTQYVLRRVAPRRIWPVIAFGASVACWYEHISRTICFLICKNHRLWEFLFKLVTRNSVRTFLMEGFWCHTHNAAWHTLHNIICGSAGRVERYLDAVREQLNCDVNVFHGTNDELLPVECSLAVRDKVPRAKVKLVPGKDHITIVVGRQKAFARELEEIWKNSSADR